MCNQFNYYNMFNGYSKEMLVTITKADWQADLLIFLVKRYNEMTDQRPI